MDHANQNGANDVDERSTFGSRVAGRRRVQRIAQKDMAALLGVTPRYLSMIENDGRKPSFEVFIALAQHLDVSLDYLAGTRAEAERLVGK